MASRRRVRALPAGADLKSVLWTADGRRFALTVELEDHHGLWVGSVDGELRKIEGLTLNPLVGPTVQWLPDQQRLLVQRIPERGPAPQAPPIPAGPEIMEGAGASARSMWVTPTATAVLEMKSLKAVR